MDTDIMSVPNENDICECGHRKCYHFLLDGTDIGCDFEKCFCIQFKQKKKDYKKAGEDAAQHIIENFGTKSPAGESKGDVTDEMVEKEAEKMFNLRCLTRNNWDTCSGNERGTWRFHTRIRLEQIAQSRKQIQSLAAKLAVCVEALNKLARLGNGDKFGNSIGNTIAQDALTNLPTLVQEHLEKMGRYKRDSDLLAVVVNNIDERLKRIADNQSTKKEGE